MLEYIKNNFDQERFNYDWWSRENGYVSKIIDFLPPYINTDLKDFLVKTHPDIPLTHEMHESVSVAEGKELTLEQEQLIVGTRLLTEITTDTLTQYVLDGHSEESISYYAWEFNRIAEVLGGFDDTFKGLIQHLQIAALSGSFRDLEKYSEDNYGYKSIEELAQKVGGAFVIPLNERKGGSTLTDEAVGKFNYKNREIYINPSYYYNCIEAHKNPIYVQFNGKRDGSVFVHEVIHYITTDYNTGRTGFDFF